MFPDLEHGGGILLAAIGIGLLLLFAGRSGWRNISMFGLTFNRPREKSAKEMEWDREDAIKAREADRRQVAEAFRRYADAAVGLASIVESAGPPDRVMSAWFDLAAEALAAALTVYPEDHFRVAIWADYGHPDQFKLLGSANHDRNDAGIQTLGKADTIAGRAFASRAGEYLCADIVKDRRFKSRTDKKTKPYKQVFAIAVGNGRWGVVTIDAPRAGAFEETEVALARRFALLIAAGAVVATARYAPAGTRVQPAPSFTPVPRIVNPPSPQIEAVDEEASKWSAAKSSAEPTPPSKLQPPGT